MTDKKANSQKGFTLIETLISIALLTGLLTTFFGVAGPWLEFKNSATSQQRLELLKKDFESLYLKYPYSLNNSADQKNFNITINTSSGTNSTSKNIALTLSDKSSTDANGSCTSLRPQLQKLSALLTQSPSVSAQDTSENPVCIFVYVNQAEMVQGALSISRTFVFASPGKDGVFDTKFDVGRASQINKAGDDIILSFNGGELQRPYIEKIVESTNRIGKAYEDYAYSRFSSNPAKDITIYYFCSGYDLNGTIIQNAVGNPPRDFDNSSTIACSFNNFTENNLYQNTMATRIFGVTGEIDTILSENPGLRIITNNTATLTGPTYADAGGTIQSQTFTAKTPQSSGTTPPYTAILYTRLPGNALYVKTLVGRS